MKSPVHLAVALAGLLATTASPSSAEIRWFPGTQRALPPSLAAFKEDGIASRWNHTSNQEWVWDFNLGTDVCMWERVGENSEQTIGARFGVASRFEFGTESFDLWATDLRGGAVWGLRRGPWTAEAFLFHESSHLGDEILERGERRRRDVAVNGVRLTASREWTNSFRLYGGLRAMPWAEPDDLRGLGLHAGAERSRLPPFERGYVAGELEAGSWRHWNPDLTLQAGVFLASRTSGSFLSRARAFVEFYSGAVHLGQFFDETETSLGLGLALQW
jgi:hypothetical protein